MKKLFPILACVCFLGVLCFAKNGHIYQYISEEETARLKEMAENDRTFDNVVFSEPHTYPVGTNYEGTTYLQRSLYYQGFNPEFFKPFWYNKYVALDFEEQTMTPLDCDLKHHIVPRDAKKAFEYSKLYSMLLDSSNYVNLCFNGIGTPRDTSKALDFFKYSNFWEMSAEEILDEKNRGKIYWDARDRFHPLYAYMLYHGIEVEKNVEKCNAILSYDVYMEAWKNFYCGYLAPKDFDFAIYCLEHAHKNPPRGWVIYHIKNKRADNLYDIIEFWPAQCLANIYAGKYLPEHADKEKAEYWQKQANERYQSFLKKFNEREKAYLEQYEKQRREGKTIDSLEDINYRYILLLYGSKTRTLFVWGSDMSFTFNNPYYDIQKRNFLIEELRNEYYFPSFGGVLHEYKRGGCEFGKPDQALIDLIERLYELYKLNNPEDGKRRKRTP